MHAGGTDALVVGRVHAALLNAIVMICCFMNGKQIAALNCAGLWKDGNISEKHCAAKISSQKLHCTSALNLFLVIV